MCLTLSQLKQVFLFSHDVTIRNKIDIHDINYSISHTENKYSFCNLLTAGENNIVCSNIENDSVTTTYNTIYATFLTNLPDTL